MDRLCPKCGKKMPDLRCPDDSTGTLFLTDRPEARFDPGAEINGRYRIDKLIGSGGFGAVYRGKSLTTGQDIAIKVLTVALNADDPAMLVRFFAEAQITASLQHPNTIRVFDFGQAEGGALYLAMELLNGHALIDLLEERAKERRALSMDETITYGAQVLRALAEAHLAELVHRDLKPHNIFLHRVKGDDPVVKVLDFGIAKQLGRNLTGTGQGFGTPQYMSPEHARGKPVDRRTDIYAMGVILYQCVAGVPPFRGDDPMAILLSHVTDAPPNLRHHALSDVTEGFVRVVEKALEKNPNDRFVDVIEMRQALEAARGGDRLTTNRQVVVVVDGAVGAGQERAPAPDDARTATYIDHRAAVSGALDAATVAVEAMATIAVPPGSMVPQAAASGPVPQAGPPPEAAPVGSGTEHVRPIGVTTTAVSPVGDAVPPAKPAGRTVAIAVAAGAVALLAIAGVLVLGGSQPASAPVLPVGESTPAAVAPAPAAIAPAPAAIAPAPAAVAPAPAAVLPAPAAVAPAPAAVVPVPPAAADAAHPAPESAAAKAPAAERAARKPVKAPVRKEGKPTLDFIP